MDQQFTNTTIIDFFNTAAEKATSSMANLSENASVAGEQAGYFWGVFQNLNWSQPTWDIVIFLFFVIAIFIYGFALGRDRIIAILVSTYLSLAVATNMPYMDRIADWLNSKGLFAFQLSAFLVVFIVLFIFLSRSYLVDTMSGISGGVIQTFIFSILLVGLLGSIILSFLPHEAIAQLSDLTQNVFLSDIGRFVWIFFPVVALILFKRNERY